MRLLLVLAALAAFAARPGSAADASHYVAAVLEYAAPVLVQADPEEILLENIDAAGLLMAKAGEQGADIIVLPENGMQGYGNQPFPMPIPAPEDHVTPCTAEAESTPKGLRRLSCLAAQHKMYLVVNLVHEVSCSGPECPPRGSYHYNTNVAFDRSGQVVARYHKYNLFGEKNNNVPPTVEYSFFDTDFGVRFGMFTCFDILFDKPAAELARKHKVTDFVFTTAWFSEVPFLTAVQAHSGWAHALDVTVLAAGINYPPSGSSGSGVYLGRHGVLNATTSARTETTLMVQRVPKHSHWEDVDDVRPDMDRFDPVLNYGARRDPYSEMRALRMIQDNMTLYATTPLRRLGGDEEDRTRSTLCVSNGLCCHFDVRTRGVALFQTSSAAVSLHGHSRRQDDNNKPAFDKGQAQSDFDGFHYKLVAFSGVRDHSHVASTGVQVCGLVSCLSDAIESCGWITPGLGSSSIHWTEFLEVRIEAEFESEGTLQLPSTLAGPRYDPLPASIYEFHHEPGKKPGTRLVSLSLNTTPIIDLRTFAIYGRYFAWDGQTPTEHVKYSSLE